MAGNGVLSGNTKIRKKSGQDVVEMSGREIFSVGKSENRIGRAVNSCIHLHVTEKPEGSYWAAVVPSERENIQEFALRVPGFGTLQANENGILSVEIHISPGKVGGGVVRLSGRGQQFA
jgi:hypothetical protein